MPFSLFSTAKREWPWYCCIVPLNLHPHLFSQEKLILYQIVLNWNSKERIVRVLFWYSQTKWIIFEKKKKEKKRMLCPFRVILKECQRSLNRWNIPRISLVKFAISIISVISSKKGKYFSGRYFKEGRYFWASLLSGFVINLWNCIATCRYVQNFTVTNSCRSVKKTRFLFAFQFAKCS